MINPDVRAKILKHTRADLLPRADYVYNFFKECKPIFKNSSILNLGCGCGYNIESLRDLGYTDITGLDRIDVFKKDGWNDWDKRLKFICGEAEQIMPTLEPYDIILCDHFLYVQPDDSPIFKLVADRFKKFLVILEREDKSQFILKYKWERNYKELFEKLGLKQLFYEKVFFQSQGWDYHVTHVRIFVKHKHKNEKHFFEQISSNRSNQCLC